MRVLVTGASGHVGGAIAAELVGRGMDVVALDRRPSGVPGLAEQITMDLSASEADVRLLANTVPCSVIVHAAASLDMAPYATEVSATNCLGTHQLLRCARDWAAEQFIFLSSVPVIGEPRVRPITEEHPVLPLTAYHASKLYGEHLVRLAAPDIPATASLRLTAPVGPGMPAGRIVHAFVQRALAGEPLTLFGKGTRRQNYVDVRDLARAVAACIQERPSGVFNVASDECVSNLELAERCVRVLDSPSQVEFADRDDPEDGVVWDVSIAKARDAFGYEPQFSLEDSLKAVAAEQCVSH